MTRRRDMMLEDLLECGHELTIPISENGEIISWRCDCGARVVKAAEREKEGT